jgi:hypothetical protein
MRDWLTFLDTVGLHSGSDLCAISTAIAQQVYRQSNCLRSPGASCEDVHLVGVSGVRDTDRIPVEHAWLVPRLFLLVLGLWLRLFSCRLFVPLLLYRVPVVLHHPWAGRCGDLPQRGHRIHVVRCPVLVNARVVRVALFSRGMIRLIDGRGHLSAGVLQPYSQLGWWQWMYYVSPFTYVIEGLLAQGEASPRHLRS